MNIKYLIIMGLFSFLFNSCDDQAALEKPEPSPADQIFAKALEAHGGDLYKFAHYQFVFRDKSYTFEHDEYGYEYSMTEMRGDSIIVDELVNGSLMRKINREEVELTKKDYDKYLEALNSVIYFATLPYKLKDDAVNKEYKGEVDIKGKSYSVLKVTFDQEGGGKDHDDNFYYWINKSTNLIDYLAYDYTANEGGVRFREANNTRNVAGIVFQDYVNYKAEVGTPLAELPALFEKGELKKLSEINTEKVKSLSTKE